VKKITFVALIAVVIVGVMAWMTPVKDISGRPLLGASFNAEILTNSDIIKMSNAHLSDAAIIMAIDSTHGAFAFDVRPDALVALKNAGVSDKMIETVMQRNLVSVVKDSKQEKPDDAMTPWRLLCGFGLVVLFAMILRSCSFFMLRVMKGNVVNATRSLP
jgi:hypothetical protein